MISKLMLVLRTVRHLKLIQVWYRIWRKRLSFARTMTATCKGGQRNASPLPTFTFLNTTAQPQGWNDLKLEKLWLYNLHYFDYLRDDMMVGSEGEQWKQNLVRKWIDENPVGLGNGWEPYPISLRTVNWIKWLIARGELVESVTDSLYQQVSYLEKRLEYHLLANHLLANAKALVFAGAYLKNERWYKKGLSIYRKQLPEQTCADGVNFERSPMYHCIILEDLLDCLWLIGREDCAEQKEEAVLFKTYAEKMIAGLKLVTGPDGKIAKFNDSTEGIAKQPSELMDYAKRLGLNIEVRPINSDSPKTSGFIRKTSEGYTMLAKCGEIGPSYQPGHAHADTYSFELWRGQTKIIGDTGCSTYLPGATRSYERSTVAHNTVVIDGKNSSEVWAAHRVGRRFDFGEHRRIFELTSTGLKGTDEIWGDGTHEIDVRFHLPPKVESVKINCPGERTEAPCEFSAGWNKREKGTCISFRQRVPLPIQINWSIQ